MRSTRLLGIALLTALASLAALAAPSQAKDRNGDRIPDRWERSHHLTLKVNQARKDQDHDGLKNRAEFRSQTDPRDADSDNDGVKDGKEDAGTIAKISGDMVTVNLFHGSSITAKVTPQTDIECDTGGDDNGDGSGDEGEGDNNGNHGDNNERSLRHDSGGEESNGSNNDDNGDNNNGDHESDNQACPVGAFKEGATVQEADIKLSNGDAVFEKIELVG
jgi:hypothetical protein